VIVEDGREAAEEEQLREPCRVDAIGLRLLAGASVLALVRDDDESDERGGQVVEPGGVGALLEGESDTAREAAKEIGDGLGLGLEDGLGDDIAV
jgi:hypothetical protein